MKITQKEALEILKSVGLADVQVVATDAESDFAATTDPVTIDSVLQTVDAARKPIIQTAIQGEIHSKVSGTINNALRKQLSELTGVPVDSLKDKDSKEAMKIALDHWNTTAGGDKTAHAEKIKELLKAGEDNVTRINAEWEAKYNTEVNKLTNKEIIDLLVKEHNAAKGLPPTANKALLAEQFKIYLDTIAIVKVNSATGKLELYDKAKPEELLLNTAKTAQVQVGDLIKPRYTELGLWHEDARNVNAAEQMRKIDLHAPKGADGKPVSTLEAQRASVDAWANQGVAAT